MNLAERRKLYQTKLNARYQESYDRKDDSGKFKSVFIKERVSGVERWKCSEDEHSIDIIPYIAGRNNPTVPEGEPAYNLDFSMHRKVGVNEDNFVCLARTFKLPCPLCDRQTFLRKKLQETIDKLEAKQLETEIKALNPTRRAVYNIVCHDNSKEESLGIQLWDVSHYLFERELAEQAKMKKGGGFVPFSHPDEGKIVSFRRKGSGELSTEYKAFSFEDRPAPISNELLDKALCLDEILYIPSYEEVEAAFLGVSAKGGESAENKVEVTKEEKPREEKVENKQPEPEPEPKPEKDIPEELGEPACPAGGDFGADNMAYEVCVECSLAELCIAKAQEIADEKEKKRLERVAAAQKRKEAAEAPAAAAAATTGTRTRTRPQIQR